MAAAGGGLVLATPVATAQVPFLDALALIALPGGVAVKRQVGGTEMVTTFLLSGIEVPRPTPTDCPTLQPTTVCP